MRACSAALSFTLAGCDCHCPTSTCPTEFLHLCAKCIRPNCLLCAPLQLTSAEPGGPAELDLEALESHLRSALLKVQYCDSYLRKLPSSCTFEVVAYTSGRSGPGGVANDEWVEEQPAPGRLELAQVCVRWGFWRWDSCKQKCACLSRVLGFKKHRALERGAAVGATHCSWPNPLAAALPCRRLSSYPSSRVPWRGPSSCSCTQRASQSGSAAGGRKAAYAAAVAAAEGMAACGMLAAGGSAGPAAHGPCSPVLCPQPLEPPSIEDELAAVLSCSSDEEGEGSVLEQAGSQRGAAGPAATTSLSLVGAGLTAVPADLAARYPALRRLCLHGNAIAGVAGLGGLAALRNLNLSSNSIAALPAGALSGLLQLTSLSLASNCLAQLEPGSLAGLPRLRRLSLAHNSLASLAGLAALRGSPLQRLDVRDNALSCLAEFSVLASLPQLAELHVTGGTPGKDRSAVGDMDARLCVEQCPPPARRA